MMNALSIKVYDKSKQLRFGETLTTGSRYAVQVEGGAATCGADAALILSTPAGLQVAVATLADGAGTLDLNCDAILKLEATVPFGTVLVLNAVLRCFDSGAEQNVGVGQCQVVAAWQGAENPDTGTVVYYKGRKGDPLTWDDLTDGQKEELAMLAAERVSGTVKVMEGETVKTNTVPGMRAAIEAMARALGATVAALALAVLPAVGATVQTAPLNGLDLDANPSVVTNVTLDGLVPASRKVNGKALSADVTLSASDVGAAPSSVVADVQAADGKATTAIAYLQGDDAKVVVTNYDSAVTMPSQSLQQRIDEGGSNYWKVVWNELTRWNRFTGDGFDWAAWCGFNCFRTNILAQLDEKADRAWGFYDSHTGNYAPDGYTWLSSPKIAIAAGLAYQRTVTTEGAVWVLTSNGLVTETGGNMTNGFFRISDDEGNALFEIVKGNKRTVGAQAGSLTTTSVMGITHMHITYAVVSESHPTVMVCNDLAARNWKAETSGDCIANVSWTGSSGAWVAEVWGKTAQTEMFVKAEYEVGGETYIKNAAPISAEGGILCTDGIHKVRPVYNNGSITWEVVP